LLGFYSGLYGCKTGVTTNAGPCFAGYYQKNGLKLALIVLASKSMDSRWLDIEKMINWILSAK
jgi:D-alanyl-D-alanine carboxypeptidase